jgi:hypothetical protein
MAVSAPIMVAGLVAVAVADGWAMRLGGSAMVIGGSLAPAVTAPRARGVGWALALMGAVAVLAACLPIK